MALKKQGLQQAMLGLITWSNIDMEVPIFLQGAALPFSKNSKSMILLKMLKNVFCFVFMPFGHQLMFYMIDCTQY